MAFRHGKSTRVYLNAVDISGYLNNVELQADTDVADTTTFGATWKNGLTGAIAATATYGGLYDGGNAQADLLPLLAPGVLTICPVGASAIGEPARLLNAYDTTYSESVPVGGIVAIAGNWSADGTVGIGDVLHPLGEDTNNTTGASKNDTAETLTGWTAHLHVTLVDGGSWVVKLQDSPDDGVWTDVAAGAFTAATTATSQRLTGAVGATLQQYVRYVATRTGGTAGNGITFILAYARN